MSTRTPLSCAGAILGLALSVPAQVVVSEINFTQQFPTDDQWIELLNISANAVDLSQWSLYYATNTPSMAGNYWYAFPAGTVLQPADFVRVHWLAPVPTTGQTATEIYTGATVFHFLFGYFPEALLTTAGALGLYSTQDNANMNDPAFIEEWVTWGASGLPREDLAVQAGRWNQGEFVTPPVVADSIALIYDLNAEPTPASAFFHDASPTPTGHNHSGAASTPFGNPCTFGSLPAPTLSSLSVATAGNRDFRLRIDDTTVGPGTILFFGSGRANPPIKPPLPGPCTILVDLPILPILIPTAPGSTNLPLPLVGAPGGISAYIQSFTAFDATNHALSNGLQLDLGL